MWPIFHHRCRSIRRPCAIRIRRIVKEDAAELCIGALVLAAYASNRWLDAWSWIIPELFCRNHFGDLMGGILFPSYVNLILSFSKSNRRIAGLRDSLLIGCLCAFSWELVAPSVFAFSTADPIDALLYIAGTVFHDAAKKAIMRTRHFSPSNTNTRV